MLTSMLLHEATFSVLPLQLPPSSPTPENKKGKGNACVLLCGCNNTVDTMLYVAEDFTAARTFFPG